jgi:hypothetical protein
LAVVTVGDAVRTSGRTFVQERRFGSLSNEAVPDLLDRYRFDLLRVAGCRRGGLKRQKKSYNGNIREPAKSGKTGVVEAAAGVALALPVAALIDVL